MELAKKEELRQVLDWIDSNEEFVFWTGVKFSYPIQPKEFDDHLEKSETYGFVFRDNNEDIIGYGELSKVNLDNKSGFISRLIVSKSARNKKYGKRMIDGLINYARTSLNLEKVCLNVFNDNKIAIKMYSDLGFEEIENSSYRIEFNGEKKMGHTKYLNL